MKILSISLYILFPDFPLDGWGFKKLYAVVYQSSNKTKKSGLLLVVGDHRHCLEVEVEVVEGPSQAL
eukprot:7609141-Heterocapsa_arctica.AAC.1